jgi:hypothetical protein
LYMKKILTRLQSFATFDLPLRNAYIQQAFVTTHENYCREYRGWSVNATRKKVIAKYWIERVLIHFAALYLTGLVITLPFNTNFDQFYLPTVFVVGLLSLLTSVTWIYGPSFYFDFLPKLDTIVENYQGKQLQHLKKCQQAQMSNFAAAVVYYAFAKIGGLPISAVSPKYGEQLMTLFGKDPCDMQKALKMIACKVSSLSPHKQTEIGKSLEEARCFFEAIEFPQGIKIVEHLDAKFMKL